MTTRLIFTSVLVGLIVSLPVITYAQTETTATEDVSTTPPGLTIHVVQSGENLFRIALRYGLTTAELAELNGIFDVSNIQVGQRLLVPSEDVAVPATPQTHIVQPGESLFSIAQLYALDVDTLLAANALVNPNQIYPGQELALVSEVANQTPDAEATESPNPPENDSPVVAEALLPEINTNIHVVQAGETLFRIALRYNTSVNDMVELNNLTDATRIFAGQQLLIPGFEPPEVALDVPDPIIEIDIDPLIFMEGETGVISLSTSMPTTITGTFIGRDLRVITQEDQLRHIILIGIPIFTDAGTYPITLNLSNNDGTQTEFSFMMRVASGGYFTQNLNVTTQTPPSVQDEEIAILTRLTSNFTPQRLHEGLFSIPAAAAMNAPFGTRRSYNSGPVNTYHTGADFASAPGTPIFAAASGQVVLADALTVRGNTVMIDHGWGIYSLYAHLTTLNVSLGQSVTTGETIGTAGSTGRVTGPHLHWEVWLNGIPVNPLQWLQRTFP